MANNLWLSFASEILLVNTPVFQELVSEKHGYWKRFQNGGWNVEGQLDDDQMLELEGQECIASRKFATKAKLWV